MKGVVHDAGMHESVKNPSCNAIERSNKISEGIATSPKRPTIVAEEVVN